NAARLVVWTGAPSVPEAVTSAVHLDDLGVMEKAVQNGCGGRDIVEELSPFFNGPVGGHERRSVFIASHDDLQKNFPGFGREYFESHIIDLQKVGLEIAGQGPIQLGGRLIGLEFTDQIKDGTVDHLEARFDEMVTNGLDQVTL